MTVITKVPVPAGTTVSVRDTSSSVAGVTGVRIADMSDLGTFDSTSSVVGEKNGSGRFSAAALSAYFGQGSGRGVYYVASKSDGITDDSAAVSATIAAAIAAGGGMIVLSAGRTLLGSAITVSIPATVTITVEGMGADVSELYFPNPTDGLSFTLSYVASPRSWAGVHLRGFSVTRGPTSPVVANTGISIAKTADALYQGTSSLRDLLVQGSGGYAETNGWNIGILLSSVGGTVVDNVNILGAGSIATDRGDKLLSTVGGPVGGAHPYVASINIANCYLQGGSCGIDVNEYVQGVFVNNTTVIGQYDSIRWALLANGSPIDHAHGGEQLGLTNCTLNAGHRGLWISFVNQCAFSNTTILHYGSGVAAAWAGIEVNQCGFNSITGNNVTGLLTGTETAILLTDCDPGPNSITGNTCANILGAGLWFKGNSSFNTAAGNNFTTGPTGSGIVQDIRGANTIVGNQWNGQDIPSTLGTLIIQHQTVYQNAAVAVNPQRWFVSLIGTGSDTGGGSNTGSDYTIVGGRDDGSIDPTAALTITRATGVVTLGHAPIIGTLPVNAANDAAAATAGVPVGGVYRNGSAMMVRVA